MKKIFTMLLCWCFFYPAIAERSPSAEDKCREGLSFDRVKNLVNGDARAENSTRSNRDFRYLKCYLRERIKAGNANDFVVVNAGDVVAVPWVSKTRGGPYFYGENAKEILKLFEKEKVPVLDVSRHSPNNGRAPSNLSKINSCIVDYALENKKGEETREGDADRSGR